MKINRFPILITLLILGSLLLSACSGAPMVNSWPGLSVDGSTVYLAFQGSLYAINAETGVMTWKFPEKPEPSKPFYAAPAVTEDLVIAGNFGHMLYAINKDGTQGWAFDSTNGNFAGSPLVVGETILAPSTNNMLYALSLGGNVLWTFETENALWTTPVSDGKAVYLPALDHNLYALNLSDGSLIWKKDLGSALLSSPVYSDDGIIYLTNMGGEVIALNSSDGSIKWQTKTDGRVWGPPLLHDGVLFTGNIDGKVSAVSAADGSIVWQQDAGSPIIGGAALLTDGVAFPTEGGSLIAYGFKGEKLWNQSVSGKLYTTPVVSGDTLVVALTEGDNLASAFKFTGQQAWTFTAPK